MSKNYKRTIVLLTYLHFIFIQNNWEIMVNLIKKENIVAGIIICSSKKREARKPKDRGYHEHVCPAQHKMTLSSLPTIELSFNRVVCLRQVYQEYAAPI